MKGKKWIQKSRDCAGTNFCPNLANQLDRKKAISIAKDFGYSSTVVKAITVAVTKDDISEALKRGRKEMFG